MVYKKLNSTTTLIQSTTTEAPQRHMYYIGLDVHKKTIIGSDLHTRQTETGEVVNLTLMHEGDAAHAMSPIAGIGINLAIQDAVAAANILARPLLEGTVTASDLAKVQRRRPFPTWVTQRLQEVIRKQTGRDVGKSGTARPP